MDIKPCETEHIFEKAIERYSIDQQRDRFWFLIDRLQEEYKIPNSKIYDAVIATIAGYGYREEVKP